MTTQAYDRLTQTFVDVVATDTATGSTALAYSMNESVIGTTPTVVGSMRLPAGTYTAPSADIGAGNPSYSATLELRIPEGTILVIGGTAGGLAWRTAATGFTLSATTDIDLVLYCNTALEPVFIKGLTF